MSADRAPAPVLRDRIRGAVTVTELASVIEGFVRDIFNKFGEFYPPCHILINGKGWPTIIASLEKNRAEEHDIDAMLRKLIRRKRSVRYAHVAEAWASPSGGCWPSEHPDRKEVVIINVEQKGGEAITGLALVERDAGGVRTLGKFDWSVSGSAVGHFARIFASEPFAPHMPPQLVRAKRNSGGVN
jgi:hypothetical protein